MTTTPDTKPTTPEVSDPRNLVFTEEQLAQLHSLVERETRHAYDEVAEGIFRATREFASCFADLPLADGTTLVLDSADFEQFAEQVNEVVWLHNYEVEGFDAMNYHRRQLEARQLNAN